MGDAKGRGVALIGLNRISLSSRTVVAALATLALAKGLVWSAVIPPWYGPDEASHFAYVQGLVENHWLPSGPIADAATYYPHDILCSEHRLDIGIYSVFDAEPPFGIPIAACDASSRADRLASSPLNAAAGYTPAYYVAATPFYLMAYPLAVETRLDAVRLWSVLLGVLATVFAYLAALRVFAGQSRLAVATAVLFALQPMNSQQTAIVNNDALLIAVAAAFWWRFFRDITAGVTLGEGVLLGGLVGLAYLAKPQGVFLAAALPIVYFLGLGRVHWRGEVMRAARLAAAAATPVLIAIGIAQLLSVQAGNSSRLGGAIAGPHGLQQYVFFYSQHHFERLYLISVTSFWGYFGWFQVDLPSLAYVIVTIAVALGIAGSVWLAMRSPTHRPFLVASMLAFLIPAAMIQLLELYTFRITGQLILQGRSFLLLLLPFLIVLVWGWQHLMRDRGGRFTAAAVILGSAALNVVSLLVMMDGFYG